LEDLEVATVEVATVEVATVEVATVAVATVEVDMAEVDTVEGAMVEDILMGPKDILGTRNLAMDIVEHTVVDLEATDLSLKRLPTTPARDTAKGTKITAATTEGIKETQLIFMKISVPRIKAISEGK
jgi:hypothetical protein